MTHIYSLVVAMPASVPLPATQPLAEELGLFLSCCRDTDVLQMLIINRKGSYVK